MQVALWLVLVTVAVFTLQVFRRVSANGPGFRITQIAKVSVDTAYRQYSDGQTRRSSSGPCGRAPAARRDLRDRDFAMPLWGVETI